MPSPFRWPRIRVLLLALGGGLSGQGTQAAERLEFWPDGSIRTRFAVDDQGRRHGTAEEFAQNGARTLLANYRHGLRDGMWREWDDAGRKGRFLAFAQDQLHGHCEEYDPDGTCRSAGDHRAGRRHGSWVELDANGRRRAAEYRDGVLHGSVRITLKDRVLSRQEWKHGELVELDDLAPFPVARGRLLEELRSILAQPTPTDAGDPLAAQRLAALHRLQLYRHLCGLPWQGMELVADWNLRCDAAAEACRRLGRLDHQPPPPAGMDEARYRLGLEGAGHSNLAINGSLVGSVDAYMDDSDPGNIDRVGHRRWCLNPAMQKTGFGSDGQFHAMWSMDQSGGQQGGGAVCYPPRGYVPVDLFDARRAFSIALFRGGLPKKSELVVRVQPLDGDYIAAGEVLPLDWCDLAGGSFGGAACLVFRPVGLVVEPGGKYLVDVSTDAGKTSAHRYLVEFCEPVAAPTQR